MPWTEWRKPETLDNVEITEKALRELLSSIHGQKCGESILNTVMDGEPVLLTTSDGKKVVLSDVAETSSFLKEQFGWAAEAAA